MTNNNIPLDYDIKLDVSLHSLCQLSKLNSFTMHLIVIIITSLGIAVYFAG